MKILELEDGLESLENELLIICETANALEIPLGEGALEPEQVCFVLAGITKGIRESSGMAGKLAGEMIKIRGMLADL